MSAVHPLDPVNVERARLKAQLAGAQRALEVFDSELGFSVEVAPTAGAVVPKVAANDHVPSPDDKLTADEAAAIIGCKSKTIYDLPLDELPRVPTGNIRKALYFRRDVEAYRDRKASLIDLKKVRSS